MYRAYWLVLLLVAWGSASAHHSPAAYDLQAVTAVTGTVNESDWGNPHVYVSVREDGSGRVWIVEAFASTAMKQYGWSSDLLKPGERVQVVGNPSRNVPSRNVASSALYLAIAAQGGCRTVRRCGRFCAGTRELAAASEASEWSRRNVVYGARPDVLSVSRAHDEVAGDAQRCCRHRGVSRYGEPGADCVPPPPPVYMVLPGFRSIEVRDDQVLIRGEDTALERVVRMGVAADGGEGVHGRSIGHWEGRDLLVETTRFTPHRIGNGGGLPSGERKRLSERFALTPEGRLRYSFVLEDPEYLAEPVSGSALWVYRPEIAYAATPCSATNARRFLAG